MADIISLKDRQRTERPRFADVAAIAGHCADILLFTGIYYERLEPVKRWTRVELPTSMAQLPSPANPV